MKTRTILLIALTNFLLLSSFIAFSQPAAGHNGDSNTPPNLDSYFSDMLESQKFVGLGACLIKGDEIVWQGSYGYADLEEKKPLTNTTIFQLASLSKVVTATALMQLYEKGLFKLDDDVNNYIALNVRNPRFPEKPITFRMLLTHRAGFADVTPTANKFSLGVLGDSPIPLQEFVEQVFTPGGKYYSADYFSTSEPGTKYEYSNMAFWLIGYLVEKIGKKDFAEFCKENIFTPLGMQNTSWRLKDLDTSRVAFCYMVTNFDTLTYRKVRHFGVPGYPEGMLRTTMEDFSRFVSLFMNAGKYRGRQILQPQTVALMLEPQHVEGIPSRGFKVVDIALTWHIHDIDGEQLYTMNGFSGSIFTNVYFSPAAKVALMFYYTGISMKTMPAMVEITRKLRDAAKRLDAEERTGSR